VKAFDRASAGRRADDNFDDAKAILMLASKPWSTPSEPRIFSGENPSSNSGRAGGYLPLVDGSTGLLAHPGLRGLEEAALRDFGKRTDWERRVLTAARWLVRARFETWPSAALAASMTCMDILFVRDKKVAEKGKTIAREVSSRFTINGESKKAINDWLADLYRNRNAVVHDGGHYLQDPEIKKLLSLVNLALLWASEHLEDEHYHGGIARTKVCDTYDEAMS
jgi:hypothetical protein